MNEPVVLEVLPSKKNHVVRDNTTVIKVFTDRNRFKMEQKIGDLLQGTNILTPDRISINEVKQEIIYIYINGTPVVDLIDQMELLEATKIINMICTWLVDFYSLVGRDSNGSQYILGDIHLRNFIYQQTSQQLYGVDFEDCHPGRVESDAARMYVYIVNYDPAFTPQKKALAASFWETISTLMPLDETLFQREIVRETEELLIRRQNKR